MSYLQDETDAPAFDQRIYGITIATDAADLDDRIDIIVPNLDGNVRWPDARWQARDGYTLPKRGMEGVAVLDDNNEFWVIGWWPESPVAHPLTTVGKFSDGPPDDPEDGDIWIATQVDQAGGVVWEFLYDTTGSTAYYWKFKGGSSLIKRVETGENTSSASYTDLATVGPSYTIIREGDYLLRWGFHVSTNSTNGPANGEVVVSKNGTPQSFFGSFASLFGITAFGHFNTGSGERVMPDLAVNDVLKLQYLVSNGTSATFDRRYLSITPERVI